MALIFIFTKYLQVLVQFCIINIFVMKTKILLLIANTRAEAALADNKISYLIGGIIALLILGYLIYTLLHPEKF
jgi:K+-transporting ATPase KdpF subunit